MNKEIRYIIILFLLNALLMGWAYFNGNTGHVPVTGISHLLMGVVTSWVAIRLFFIKNKTSDLITFALFFSFLSLFLLFMALPHTYLLFPRKNDEAFINAMQWGFIIGHMFTYLAHATFVRLTLGWSVPRLKNLGTVFFSLGTPFFLIFGGIITAFNIMRPGNPVFDLATGLTLFHSDPLVGNLIAIETSLLFIPSAIFFIVKGIKSQEKIVRNRALFIGFGLVVTTIGGPLHDIAQVSLVVLMADTLVLAGLCILAVGVFYKIGVKNTEPQLTTNI